MVKLEGKHLVSPTRAGGTVLPACIIQNSPLLYFTLPSSSHVKEPRHMEGGGARELDEGGETLERE